MSTDISTSTERKNIINFIKNISQENYAEADKYLQGVVDLRLKEKIKEASKQRIF